MKRLGFFVFFDPDGIVDDYVLYLLECVKPFLNNLVVISNGKLSIDQKNKLANLGDLYIERLNRGFDFGAWKEALLYHFNRDELTNYDELLFFNDTIYGPTISMDKIINHFDNTSAGLWGLTRFGNTVRNGKLYEPFIQTYFWGAKRSFFTDDIFFDFWNCVDENTNDFSLAQEYEIILSNILLKSGNHIDTYIDCSKYEAPKDEVIHRKKYNKAIDKYANLYLLKHGFPFVKRKNFFYDREKINEYIVADDLYASIEYIKHHSSYDIDMIFRHILRIKNGTVVRRALNYNYIIDDSFNVEKKVATLCVLLSDDKEFVDSAINQTDEYSFYVIVGEYQNYNNRNVYYLNEDELCKDFLLNFLNIHDSIQYICIFSDRFTGHVPELAKDSIRKLCYSSLMKSKEYINHIVKVFVDNNRIGCLYPYTDISIENNYNLLLNSKFSGAWSRRDIFMKLLECKNIFCNNANCYIRELVFQLFDYCEENALFSTPIIPIEYASIIISNIELMKERYKDVTK